MLLFVGGVFGEVTAGLAEEPGGGVGCWGVLEGFYYRIGTTSGTTGGTTSGTSGSGTEGRAASASSASHEHITS